LIRLRAAVIGFILATRVWNARPKARAFANEPPKA
jgi:hypothetical protein